MCELRVCELASLRVCEPASSRVYFWIFINKAEYWISKNGIMDIRKSKNGPVSDSHQKSDRKTPNQVILHESVKGFITKEFDYFGN